MVACGSSMECGYVMIPHIVIAQLVMICVVPKLAAVFLRMFDLEANSGTMTAATAARIYEITTYPWSVSFHGRVSYRSSHPRPSNTGIWLARDL